jgi:hypothetical protein
MPLTKMANYAIASKKIILLKKFINKLQVPKIDSTGFSLKNTKTILVGRHLRTK